MRYGRGLPVGRNAISWEKKFKLDVWHVDNQNENREINWGLALILLP